MQIYEETKQTKSVKSTTVKKEPAVTNNNDKILLSVAREVTA